MNDIVWILMRRMRTPLVVLILVYFLSVITLVAVPGQAPDGSPYQLGFLEAGYFVAFMATTIGFGEIPYEFTGAQRFIVYLLIFPNVIAWLYAIGSILGLFLDPQFQRVVARSRFSRRVHWMREPFLIVCGMGNTGTMVVQGLLRRGWRAVTLERSEEAVHRMTLDADLSNVPVLQSDVSDRRLLERAGLNNPRCAGVVAVTDEDHVNLTVAITTKLLRPELPVMARCADPTTSANMASFGTDHVIDPYAIFAERLYLALTSPVKYLVQDWLISVPGTELRESLDPPDGRWIVCGAGRFGRRILDRLETFGLPCTLVDVDPSRLEGTENGVVGRGTEAATLRTAGIDEAVAVVAGTEDDVDNLSIVMTAREIKPSLFSVARQEHPRNDTLFEASGADLVARPSVIVARRILAVATTPLLQTFLQHLVSKDDEFAKRVASRLQSCLQGRAPSLWVAELTGDQADGVRLASQEGIELRLEHLLQSVRSSEPQSLPAVCLVLERGAQRLFLPDPEQALIEGDRLLFAGRGAARNEILWMLGEPNALLAAATGRHRPNGTLWRWLNRGSAQKQN